ncbi:MAG: class I SAM-dependent methyltransferase [Rhizobiales bacterium]|nr:class I SAM-dependent methyltransferase [Hyphomicrobiales bacterium]
MVVEEPEPFHCASETDAAPPHANGRRRAEPTQSDCEDWQSGNISSSTSYRQSHISPGYAEYYEKTYAEGYYAIQWEQVEKPLVRTILAGLAQRGAAHSLDFACGTGRILQLHGEVFDDVVGTDISAEMLAVARLRCPEARIVEADLTTTGVSGHVAGRQVCTAFRFFLNAEPALRADVLEVLRRCLVEGGHLVANFHCNPASPAGTFYRIRNRLSGRTINNLMSIGEAEALLRTHGFTIQAVHRYGLWPRFGWRFNRMNELLLTPAETLGRQAPVLMRFAQSFIIVARRD